MPEPPQASPPTTPIWHQPWFFPAVAAVAFAAAYLLLTFAWEQPWAWWSLGLLAGSAIAAGVAYYYRAENRYFRVGLGLLGAGALLTIPSIGVRIVGSGSEPFEAFGWVQFSDVSAVACLAAGCWMMWLDFRTKRPGPANGPAARARDTTANGGLAVGAATAGGDVTVIQGLAGEDLKTFTNLFKEQIAAKDDRIAELQDQLNLALLGAARVEDRAEAGDQKAIDAVAAARERGDTAGLLRVLVDRRNESQREQIELNREIAAIAYLHGDIAIAEEALASILQALPDDISAINESGHIAKLRGDLEKTRSCWERVLQLAGTDESCQAVAYGNLGVLYKTRGDLDAAEAMYKKSLAINEKLARKEEMASGYGNLGILYKTRGDLDAAEAMYMKALAIEKEFGRKEELANNYGNLGNLYQMRGDLNTAKAMYEKSLAINEELNRKEGMAKDYGNLGPLYRTGGDLNAAEAMHKKALDIEEELGHKEGMASDYGNLGNLYLTRGDLNAAEAMYKKSLAIEEYLGRKEGMASDYANLGVLYLQRGEVVTARNAWQRAIELFTEIGMSHRVDHVQQLLGKLPN